MPAGASPVNISNQSRSPFSGCSRRVHRSNSAALLISKKGANSPALCGRSGLPSRARLPAAAVSTISRPPGRSIRAAFTSTAPRIRRPLQDRVAEECIDRTLGLKPCCVGQHEPQPRIILARQRNHRNGTVNSHDIGATRRNLRRQMPGPAPKIQDSFPRHCIEKRQ